MPHSVQEFLIIVPTIEAGPPQSAEAMEAGLREGFPGYSFRVVRSADLRPTYAARDAELEDALRYDFVTVLPVLNSRSAPVGPDGAMALAEPPIDLVEEIYARLQTLEGGPRLN